MRRLPLRPATFTTGGDQRLPIPVATSVSRCWSRVSLITFGPKFVNPREGVILVLAG
jgi:hypothetical protein